MNVLCIFVCLGFSLTRATSNMFPNDFLFGFATASYQIEGAWNEDGKGENVWDKYIHDKTERRVVDDSSGDVACDSYHLYKEDVTMLKYLGANIYRFSLSWSRILPRGDLSLVNPAGVTYYNNLIDELLANGIEPMVTLFHWDLPQPLQNLGGWPNPLMTEYFHDYAKLAFTEFGNKVKWWITFNEPLEACMCFYGGNYGAPGLNMSGVADYLCGHTMIKSHARVYHLYNKLFKKVQKGKVGIALSGGWNQPLSDSQEDLEAAERSMEFQLGWFLHPLLGSTGDYPKIMRKNVDKNSKAQHLLRSRLPTFGDEWRTYIKGTVDFLGVNHYTTYLTTTLDRTDTTPSFLSDMNASFSQNKSWPDSSVSWLRVEPTGLRKKLNWLKAYANNFPIFITENGYADYGELDDQKRISYHRDYLEELLKAIHIDHCNVIGYIAWSLMDNFEWLQGYTAKFGVYHVDFQDPRRSRTPKSSVEFFRRLIRTKLLEPDQFSNAPVRDKRSNKKYCTSSPLNAYTSDNDLI